MYPIKASRVLIPEEIIEYAENVRLLIEMGILTKEEAGEMLGLQPKTSDEIEINGVVYEKKKS